MKSAHQSLRELTPILAIFCILGLACVVESGEGDNQPNQVTPGDGDGDGTQPGDGDGDGTQPGDGDGDGTTPTGECVELTSDEVENGAVLDGCYLVDGSLTVTGGTLQIEGGTEMYFESGRGLTVDGDDGEAAIEINGSSSNPVLMRGSSDNATAGFWSGVRIRRTGAAPNTISGLIVEHAGGRNWGTNQRDTRQGGLVIDTGADAQITDGIFRHNQHAGLSIHAAGSTVTVSGSSFEDNEGYPIRLRPNHVGDLNPDLHFSGNDDEFVQIARVRSNDPHITLENDATWPTMAIPYEAYRFYVEADLTLTPGSTFHIKSGGFVRINEGGTLNADASGADPIRFVGVSSAPGSWTGLRFIRSYSEDNVLANIEVRNGGSSSYRHESGTRGGILVWYGRLDINEAVITDSEGHGLTGHGDTTLVTGCEDMTFENISSNEINAHQRGNESDPATVC